MDVVMAVSKLEELRLEEVQHNSQRLIEDVPAKVQLVCKHYYESNNSPHEHA